MSDRLNMARILESTDKKIEAAKNIPTSIYRTILADKRINLSQWDSMMKEHLENPDSRLPKGRMAKNQYRSNLIKSIKAPAMSWKFLERALMIFKPIKIRFTIELFYEDDTSSIHTMDYATPYSKENNERMDPIRKRMEERNRKI